MATQKFPQFMQKIGKKYCENNWEKFSYIKKENKLGICKKFLVVTARTIKKREEYLCIFHKESKNVGKVWDFTFEIISFAQNKMPKLVYDLGKMRKRLTKKH